MMQEDEEEGIVRSLEATEDFPTHQQSKNHRRRIFSNSSRSKYLENSLADQIAQTAEVANQSGETSNEASRIFGFIGLSILVAILYAVMSLFFR